jgi:hypothetical protein
VAEAYYEAQQQAEHAGVRGRQGGRRGQTIMNGGCLVSSVRLWAALVRRGWEGLLQWRQLSCAEERGPTVQAGARLEAGDKGRHHMQGNAETIQAGCCVLRYFKLTSGTPPERTALEHRAPRTALCRSSLPAAKQLQKQG